MAVRLDKVLRRHGCELGSERFREMLADMFNKMFPGWNDEDLLHNPVDAIRFCDAIREVHGCEQLEDPIILRALSAMRKSSLSTSKRQGGKLSRIS